MPGKVQKLVSRSDKDSFTSGGKKHTQALVLRGVDLYGGSKHITAVPILITPNNIKYQLFAVFTNGTIQIYFQAYSKRPEFQIEERLLELLNRLNTIPGVSLPEDSIDRYRSFLLAKACPEPDLRYRSNSTAFDSSEKAR
jgi:hypothetical protein